MPRGPRERRVLAAAIDVPAPAEGQVLLRTLYLSLDPYMRQLMDEVAPIYAASVPLGQPMVGGTVNRVVEQIDQQLTDIEPNVIPILAMDLNNPWGHRRVLDADGSIMYMDKIDEHVGPCKGTKREGYAATRMRDMMNKHGLFAIGTFWPTAPTYEVTCVLLNGKKQKARPNLHRFLFSLFSHFLMRKRRLMLASDASVVDLTQDASSSSNLVTSSSAQKF